MPKEETKGTHTPLLSDGGFECNEEFTFTLVGKMDKDGAMIYPADEPHDQTFAYLFVDPFKKNITVLYHCFA